MYSGSVLPARQLAGATELANRGRLGSIRRVMSQPTPDQRIAMRQRPTQTCVMRQSWAHLLFLHWRFPVSVVQQTLPPGLTVDAFEGAAWLGVVPFFMQKVRPRG